MIYLKLFLSLGWNNNSIRKNDSSFPTDFTLHGEATIWWVYVQHGTYGESGLEVQFFASKNFLLKTN